MAENAKTVPLKSESKLRNAGKIARVRIKSWYGKKGAFSDRATDRVGRFDTISPPFLFTHNEFVRPTFKVRARRSALMLNAHNEE